jgi:hypothetical protein
MAIRTSHSFERIDGHMAHILASTSECSRLQMGFRMWTAARSVIRAAVVADHGDWSRDGVDREVAVRMSKGLVARVVT